MFRFSLCMLFVASLVILGCSKDDETPTSGSVTLKFDHVVGTRDLVLNSDELYQHQYNDQQEPYAVASLRYYVTNIAFVREDKTTYSLPVSVDGTKGFYLVDESKPATTRLEMSVPFGKYTHVVFTIGVPEEADAPGKGVLATSEGMFDSENGYTNLSLKGMFDDEPFRFESIGQSNLATYSLPIPSGAHHRTAHEVTTIEVSPTTAPQVHLIINLDSFFNGLSFTSSSLTDDQMSQFVTNYKEAIFIDHVH
jgi:hypothetical protein